MIEKGVVLKVQLVEVAVGGGEARRRCTVQAMTVLSVALWKSILGAARIGKKVIGSSKDASPDLAVLFLF